MKYPIKTWKWEGMPGHFICANKCQFRLCTIIGPYKVSTVGAYYPEGLNGDEMTEVGCNRHYETMVFHEDKGWNEIFMDGISLSDIQDRDPFKADKEAEKMHMSTCLEFANERLK